VRYVMVPWELIATADAFQDGNITEKAEALDWFSKALKRFQEQEPTLDDFPFAAAESLIALRYVRGSSIL